RTGSRRCGVSWTSTGRCCAKGVLGRVDQHGRAAQTFTAVGYGTQDFRRGGGRPEPTVNGLRTRATLGLLNLHTAVTGDAFVQLSSTRGQRQGGDCFGDSGGPILLDDTDVIVATTSFGTNPNCAGVEWDFRIDTAQALAFIRRFL